MGINFMNDNDLTKTLDELGVNIKYLSKELDWAYAEVTKLRAENLELKLKIQNLEYYLSSLANRVIN